MAITASPDNSDPKDPKLNLKVNNGDLLALKDALGKTRFISEEALLRYVLVALLQNEDTRLYIKQNGETVALKPNESLIRPADNREG